MVRGVSFHFLEDLHSISCRNSTIMKSGSLLALASVYVALGASVEATPCTTAEKERYNSLLQQDKDPFQSCANQARMYIPNASPRRLCPLSACRTWLQYMAANSPNCEFDGTNHYDAYNAKYKQCEGSSSSEGSSNEPTEEPSLEPTPSPSPTPLPTPTLTPSQNDSLVSSSSGSTNGSESLDLEELPSRKPTERPTEDNAEAPNKPSDSTNADKDQSNHSNTWSAGFATQVAIVVMAMLMHFQE